MIRKSFVVVLCSIIAVVGLTATAGELGSDFAPVQCPEPRLDDPDTEGELANGVCRIDDSFDPVRNPELPYSLVGRLLVRLTIRFSLI